MELLVNIDYSCFKHRHKWVSPKHQLLLNRDVVYVVCQYVLVFLLPLLIFWVLCSNIWTAILFQVSEKNIFQNIYIYKGMLYSLSYVDAVSLSPIHVSKLYLFLPIFQCHPTTHCSGLLMEYAVVSNILYCSALFLLCMVTLSSFTAATWWLCLALLCWWGWYHVKEWCQWVHRVYL